MSGLSSSALSLSSLSLALAASLTVVIGIVHSWLGERRLIGPLLAIEPRPSILKSGFFRNVLRFAWHITTLAWIGMAAAMLALALAPLDRGGRYAAVALGVTFLAHGLLILGMSRGRHLAWPVFLIIGGLCLVPLA